jgi:DNA polymerase-3 subunit delta
MRERVDALLRSAGSDASDPFAIVAIDGDVLAGDPGRLADEARTVGLFGGRRIVHVRAGARSFSDALESLLADPPPQTLIVIEGGALRRKAPLVVLLEKSPAAAVIACYADGEREVARLVERTLGDAGFAIGTDAREALVSLLGADRLATRSELDKLIIYARGTKRVTLEDVQAVIADASALALDDVVDAAAAGEPQAALAALAKTRRAGISASAVIGAAIRHMAYLHRLSLRVERGESTRTLVERKDLGIHFRRKPRFERALKRLGPQALADSLIALGAAALTARRTAALAESIAEREIIALAHGAHRPKNRSVQCRLPRRRQRPSSCSSVL